MRSSIGSRFRLIRRRIDASDYLHGRHRHCHRRSFAIYGVGEGWTGALTRQHIFKSIPGQFDEEGAGFDGERDPEERPHRTGSDDGTSLEWLSPPASPRPVLIYEHDDVQRAAAGWGVSAFLDTRGALRVVGRPHDLVSLLRLNRMPGLLQRWINRNHDTSATTPVGTMVSSLIGWATGSLGGVPGDNERWKVAEQFSLLDDWTRVEVNHSGGTKIGKTAGEFDTTRIKQLACGPGFLAMISECGSLYTMGVNNRGQCGTGAISNNVWTPQAVRGLSMTSLNIGGGDKISDKMASEQDQPMVQVCLGFQHGYALSRDGQVYSWGKASRGQLGRTVDSDQDPWARPIQFDNADGNPRVVAIGAGFHHGALLTEDNEVFVWGKNMVRNAGEEDDANSDGGDEQPVDPSDARTPQKVLGLPDSAHDNQSPMKVERISCGSHHTAMLMEDGSIFGIGIASDEPVPILDPVELIPPGVLELPLRHFEAHHDRTSVIDNSGAVYQVHLWNDETLREYAYFTPSYVDALLDEGHDIQSIHRGWRHTIIVTENN